MYKCNIYDSNGVKVDQLEINDNIQTVNGRVSKGNKKYYKGVGVDYSSHSLSGNQLTDQYRVAGKSDVFYLGYIVEKRAFANKFGIFQEQYQPQFTDFIGTCGVKELSMIENSELFGKSSVEVIKAVEHDKTNHQYYFEVNYKCGRVRYIERGKPKKLFKLLEYMLANDWNFVWDKDTITDISYNGLVTDVADIFKSASIDNKLGTVYSTIYSLAKRNFNMYADFIKYLNLKHRGQVDFVFNSVEILKKAGVDITELNYEQTAERYFNIVYTNLFGGKNCADCSFVDFGNQVREQYRAQLKNQLTK